MSLGAGLSNLAGKVFRIGHLGSFTDLMLAGHLASRNGAPACGVPHRDGGVTAALECLGTTHGRRKVCLCQRRTEQFVLSARVKLVVVG